MFNRRANKQTGNLGEDIAADYLIQNGYRIIHRNILFPFGEIDILAEDKKTIVIVEVKTVRGKQFGEAKGLVRFSKSRKLLLLGRAIEQSYPNRDIRIDVISITLNGENYSQVEHLRNAVWE